MVARDDGIERKKHRDELEGRIGRTDSGLDWLRRVKEIGKQGSLKKEEESDEDPKSSKGT